MIKLTVVNISILASLIVNMTFVNPRRHNYTVFIDDMTTQEVLFKDLIGPKDASGGSPLLSVTDPFRISCPF